VTRDWGSLSAEAAQCLRQGRAAQAAELFEQMTRLRPDDANSWFNLGYSLRMARQYEAALDAYAEALAKGVRGPEEAHINRAVILGEYLHRPEAAAEELRRAVQVNPGALAAWLNLGNLSDDLGDSAAAREAYRNALRAAPGNGRALARLTAIDVHEGQETQAIAMLKDALARGSVRPEDAAEMQFALGGALDAAGEFPAAFEAIVEANRIGASIRPPNMRYDPRAQEQLVDALIALPPPPSAGDFPAESSPIFICGMFRSGSTLVEQLLARHPAVTAGGELEFMPAIVAEDLRPYPRALAEASSERLRNLRDKYLEQLHGLYPNAGRITDKRPDNFLHIGLIKALFPQSHIVHTVREPLDNFLSIFFLWFADTIRYSERLDDILHYYTQYRRLMDHWRERFGSDIHDVDYDALVVDPRPELERLLSFCGLPWKETCLSPASTGAVRTASNWQVRKPLHVRSSGRWRNYERELSPVRQKLIDLGLLKDR
jgi:tetratricopeptide (TPR) repeat protein